MRAGPESLAAAAARLPLNRGEWACVAVAVVIAHAFLVHTWFFPSAFDAQTYVDIGRQIGEGGLFSKWQYSHSRTYGYPFLVSLVLRAAAWTGVSFDILLFSLQFLAFVAAAFLLRNALAPASAGAARIAFGAILVNYYVLIYTPESLTESISITLLLLVAAWWITLWRSGLSAWPLLAGSVAAGFALMVRPANVFIVAAWVFGIAILWLRQRPPAHRAVAYLGILLAAVVLPMVPQIRNNAVYYGKATPLVTMDLGLLQQTLGVQNLKYATAMPPVPSPSVYYNNPLWVGTTMSETSPWTWYFAYPLRGVVTVALHTFNMIDHDLLFTYSRNLTPWYRIPLGIVNHTVVAFGLVGLMLVRRDVRAASDVRWRDAYIVLLAAIASNWAVYAWTDVEMRFGSVLLLVLFPFAGYAAMRAATTRDARKRTAVVLGTAVYVVLALVLSAWVRDQSVQIREAERSPSSSGSAPAAIWAGSPGRGPPRTPA